MSAPTIIDLRSRPNGMIRFLSEVVAAWSYLVTECADDEQDRADDQHDQADHKQDVDTEKDTQQQ